MTTLYATFGDVSLAYEGTIPSGDQLRVQSLIKRASARLTRMMPSIEPRIASGELDPELPASLVIEAVLRVYRNPEGITQQAIGPFHKEFNPREVVSEITFDPAEVQELLAPIPSPLRPSIRLGFPTPQQVLQDVGGLSFPPDPQILVDRLALTDHAVAVKTP